jgi:hypothetical protein
VYDSEQLRVVLMVSVWASLAFGGLAFVLDKRKRLGAVGVAPPPSAAIEPSWTWERLANAASIARPQQK